jgi:hypothetical protein
VDLVVISRGVASPQAHVHGGVAAIPEPQASEGASLSPGATWVVLRVDPCDLDVLGRLESPQGWLLRVWLGDVLGYEGSIILMPEPRGTTTSWSLLSYFWLRLLLVES